MDKKQATGGNGTMEIAEAAAKLIKQLEGKPFLLVSPLNATSPIVMCSHDLSKDPSKIIEMLTEASSYTKGLPEAMISLVVSLMANDEDIMARTFAAIAGVIHDGLHPEKLKNMDKKSKANLREIATRFLASCASATRASGISMTELEEVLEGNSSLDEALRDTPEVMKVKSYRAGGDEELVN